MMSRELYDFFRKIRGSNEETGGIYEKSPVQIIGNIQCCDGAEEALGYFMASAVKTQRIFIDPSDHQIANGSAYGDCGWEHPKPSDYQISYLFGTYNNGNNKVWSLNEYCTDCRIRGTNVKPDFWE